MRVLVIGGGGYIGSHVVLSLAEAGHDPYVFDRLSNGRYHEFFGDKFLKGDIGDDDALTEIFEMSAPDAVVYLAGEIEVARSVEDPLTFYESNVSHAVRLLKVMIRYGVKNIVFSSSAAVYGSPDSDRALRESDELSPVNPYGWSKLFVERILSDCFASHGVSALIFRYFNAAGAHESGLLGELHDPETHLIPLAVRAGLDCGFLSVYGDDYATEDGSPVRDFVHVCDIASAHVAGLEYLANSFQPVHSVLNLGSGVGRTVKSVLAEVENQLGCSLKYKVGSRRQGDPRMLVADITAAKHHLGWAPRLSSLDVIVSSALAFERAHRDNRLDLSPV